MINVLVIQVNRSQKTSDSLFGSQKTNNSLEKPMSEFPALDPYDDVECDPLLRFLPSLIFTLFNISPKAFHEHTYCFILLGALRHKKSIIVKEQVSKPRGHSFSSEKMSKPEATVLVPIR